mgnify:CR=1 FL=1
MASLTYPAGRHKDLPEVFASGADGSVCHAFCVMRRYRRRIESSEGYESGKSWLGKRHPRCVSVSLDPSGDVRDRVQDYSGHDGEYATYQEDR